MSAGPDLPEMPNPEPGGVSSESAERHDGAFEVIETVEQPAAQVGAELADWKEALRREFEDWLEGIDEIPPDPADLDAAPEPDLCSFYEELAALSAESRKANRRSAEAISQWSDVLDQFQGDLGQLRRWFTERIGPESDALPRAHLLALVELLDRVRRLAAAFERPPERSWWSNDRGWRAAWNVQRGAFEILRDHLEALLAKEGIRRLETLGAPFDPGTMNAVAAEASGTCPPQTVLEEVVPGYVWRSEVLRLAQVKVSTQSPDCP